MSENERRRKYRWDRVLIETERLFNPQFSDAVVYLTGAQLEMLRNATQNLRRLGTYVSEYAMGYYLTPTVEDYDSILEIVADLEETLMGNPNTVWGYSARYAPREVEFSAIAGTNTLTWDAVPAGKVFTVNRIQAKDMDSAITRILVLVELGASSMVVIDLDAPAAEEIARWEGNLVLSEGDYLWARFYGCTAGDRLYFMGAGSEMDVP